MTDWNDAASTPRYSKNHDVVSDRRWAENQCVAMGPHCVGLQYRDFAAAGVTNVSAEDAKTLAPCSRFYDPGPGAY